jgi:UDP-glucose 4-epimerase
VEGQVQALITGGAGFIGSHLAERLLSAGDQVVVLDDLSTGSMRNIAHLVGRPGFKHRIGSVTDVPLVAELVDDSDIVIHLAAAVGVQKIIEEPTATIETNVRGTEVVLGAASRKKKLCVIASTSEVYGKASKIPFSEDDDVSLGPTTHSRWAYACSKALDEWLALAYAREKKLPVIVVRFFNTVGPRQIGRYGMVLPRFASQALAGEPITVFGSGDQARCFCHVQDSVHALTLLIGTDEAVGQVINIGNDQEITIGALAERVREVAKSGSPIVRVPYDVAYAKGFEDMERRVPDLEKLERLTGFRPTTPLDRIIEDVVEDRRRILAEGRAS